MAKKIKKPNKVKKVKGLKYKKKLFSRKTKKHEIEIITRKTQPTPILYAEVPILIEQDIGGPVSSTWISAIEWDKRTHVAHMALKNGYIYKVNIPFNVFERWYWAHSKGMFFNERIKGKYDVERTTIGASWRKEIAIRG